MKTTILTLAFAAASFAAVAQSQPTAGSPAAPAAQAPADAYTAMMAATIAEQDAAPLAVLPATIAKLERAASAKPADWLPRYYQARAYVKMGFAAKDGDEKEKFLDQAQTALDQAQKLPSADKAEVLVLQAYLYQARIQVSPMTRGPVFTGRVHEALEQALSLSPNNPRALLVLGNDFYFRPKMFGGGAEVARPYYEKARQSFATFKPATVLSPSWGEKTVTAFLQQIAAEAAGGTAATK
ncbi:TRAP transporter TatT component family protein [Hymenobacter sp. BT770]|uniref:TRAP transporter TatT component family protein n=1 Tax=Hymenobacter sp. BT770 TaxID=2886942 RepID=UPI001D12654C|nr:TRAP transporter TatT component family protein [Hymenobacter sp. BT770]MCC3154630.1 TRAP transporter TatT component family protein [Hymenobacter sp. BT770]MDO3416683.1 TRAP transporter TatT component family protein [Hymenobacter sp. BT770]